MGIISLNKWVMIVFSLLLESFINGTMDRTIQKRERQFIVILVMVGLIAGISLFIPDIIDLVSGTNRADDSAAAYFQTPTPSALVLTPTETGTEGAAEVPEITHANMSADQEFGCTYDKGFWISYTESWPLQELRFGDETYSKDQLILLINLSAPTAREYLLIELIVYTLNVYQGADGSTIAQSVADAIDWLDEHPEGSEVTDSERETADRLANILSDFIHGKLGPGICEETVISPYPSMTYSPELTLTITPTFTPTITERPILPTATFVYKPAPTNTKKPDSGKPPPPPVTTQLPPTARPSEPPATSVPTPAER